MDLKCRLELIEQLADSRAMTVLQSQLSGLLPFEDA